MSDSGPVKRDNPSGTVPEAKKPRRSRFDSAPPKPSAAAVAAILSANAKLNESAAVLASKRLAAAGFHSAAPQKRKLSSSFIPEIRLNDAGQEIDEHGNVVKRTRQPVTSLRANTRDAVRAANPYLGPASSSPAPEEGARGGRGRKAGAADRGRRSKPLRVSRAFRFVEPGKLSKLADKERERIARKEIFGAPKLSFNNMHNSDKYGSTVADVDANTVALGVRRVNGVAVPERKQEKDTPDVEWWDAVYIPKDLRNAAAGRTADGKPVPKGTPRPPLSYDQCDLENCKTRIYVEHPIPVQPIVKAKQSDSLELMLTKKERKRIRRITRANREKEKQEAIQVGLMEAPAPKVNIANMMRVLGQQATLDPTAIEARVRKQVSQRIRNHDERNAARKLTPEERRAKKKKKYMEDVSEVVHVAVFRVDDLSHGGHRFKLDVNAHSWMLTGQAIICKEPGARSLVVVEGGPRGIRKYIRLVEQRIKWNGDDLMEDDANKPNNFGGLVWQGTTAKRIFHSFKFEECNTAEAARKFMQKRGVVQYWDMVAKHTTTAQPLM